MQKYRRSKPDNLNSCCNKVRKNPKKCWIFQHTAPTSQVKVCTHLYFTNEICCFFPFKTPIVPLQPSSPHNAQWDGLPSWLQAHVQLLILPESEMVFHILWHHPTYSKYIRRPNLPSEVATEKVMSIGFQGFFT